jgi:peptide/nickel transport system permease protein
MTDRASSEPTIPTQIKGTGVPKRQSSIGRILRTALRTARGRVGLGLTLIVALIAFVGPFVGGTSPTAFTTSPYQPAGTGQGLLGGDGLGRDVLARVLHGGWLLLTLAILATALAVTVGAVAGVVAAYRRGVVDGVIMRSVDVLLALPQLVLVLLLLSVIGAKLWLLVLAVALAQAPQVARVAYAAAQDICERDFVKVVAMWGVPPRKVILRHVLPSLTTPLAVETGLRLSFSIVLISGLNFLGFGAQPPNPSWGVMVNENRVGLAANPWGVLAPAIVLAMLAIGVNMFVDALARASFGEDRGDETQSQPTTSAVEEIA